MFKFSVSVLALASFLWADPSFAGRGKRKGPGGDVRSVASQNARIIRPLEKPPEGVDGHALSHAKRLRVQPLAHSTEMAQPFRINDIAAQIILACHPALKNRRALQPQELFSFASVLMVSYRAVAHKEEAAGIQQALGITSDRTIDLDHIPELLHTLIQETFSKEWYASVGVDVDPSKVNDVIDQLNSLIMSHVHILTLIRQGNASAALNDPQAGSRNYTRLTLFLHHYTELLKVINTIVQPLDSSLKELSEAQKLDITQWRAFQGLAYMELAESFSMLCGMPASGRDGILSEEKIGDGTLQKDLLLSLVRVGTDKERQKKIVDRIENAAAAMTTKHRDPLSRHALRDQDKKQRLRQLGNISARSGFGESKRDNFFTVLIEQQHIATTELEGDNPKGMDLAALRTKALDEWNQHKKANYSLPGFENMTREAIKTHYVARWRDYKSVNTQVVSDYALVQLALSYLDNESPAHITRGIMDAWLELNLINNKDRMREIHGQVLAFTGDYSILEKEFATREKKRLAKKRQKERKIAAAIQVKMKEKRRQEEAQAAAKPQPVKAVDPVSVPHPQGPTEAELHQMALEAQARKAEEAARRKRHAEAEARRAAGDQDVVEDTVKHTPTPQVDIEMPAPIPTIHFKWQNKGALSLYQQIGHDNWKISREQFQTLFAELGLEKHMTGTNHMVMKLPSGRAIVRTQADGSREIIAMLPDGLEISGQLTFATYDKEPKHYMRKQVIHFLAALIGAGFVLDKDTDANIMAMHKKWER